MPWQDILSGEVDTNSPITSSLMNKIKGNLEWLKSALVGWNVINCCEQQVGFNKPVGSWETIVTVRVYIPNWATRLNFKIKGKTGSDASVKFRLKDADTSNYSNATGTAGSNYTWLSADWQSPPSGWQDIDIQAYITSQYGAELFDVYFNQLVIIVSEVS